MKLGYAIHLGVQLLRRLLHLRVAVENKVDAPARARILLGACSGGQKSRVEKVVRVLPLSGNPRFYHLVEVLLFNTHIDCPDRVPAYDLDQSIDPAVALILGDPSPPAFQAFRLARLEHLYLRGTVENLSPGLVERVPCLGRAYVSGENEPL